MAIDEARKKKTAWQIGFGLTGAIVLIFAVPVINTAYDLYKEGFLSKENQTEYSGTSMKNMRAMHQAVMLYYEAEGMLPHAAGWMDAAKTYVKTADLLEGEEMKKFINPNLASKDGVFGYAMNLELSEAYTDEVEDPAQTPMIFDSGDTSWNAFGLPGKIAPDPELPGGNKTVTVEGNVVELKDLLNKD